MLEQASWLEVSVPVCLENDRVEIRVLHRPGKFF